MQRNKAIVTLATGPFKKQWQQLCESNWSSWASRHGYDIKVHTEDLDSSQRAHNRAKAWQKLLVMSAKHLNSYEKCLWLDADILIHPDAPDPLLDLDSKSWAVTIESGSRFSGDSPLIKRHAAQALTEVAKLQNNIWSGGYFETWGFKSRERPLFNAGVIGFSPRYHRNVLIDLYEKWEDGGPGSLAEMLPFNLVVQKQKWHPLDGRFNRLIFAYTSAWNHEPCLTCADLGFTQAIADGNCFVSALYEKSYFLHFAGMHNLMNNIGPRLTGLYL